MAGGPTSFSQFPDGLLELLNSKHLGTAPNEISDIVGAGIDMWPFWTRTLQATDFLGGTMQNVGDALEIVVPDDELWSPIAIGGNIVAGAVGEDVRYSILVNLSGSPVAVRLKTSPELTAVAVGDSLLFGTQFEGRRIYGPATKFGMSLDMSTLTAARVASIAMSFVRIRKG